MLNVTWNGRWHARRPGVLPDLPPHVSEAFLAAEDVRFYSHRGIDCPDTIRKQELGSS